MEFKIKREEFLKSLSWTQSVVERKTTMPILSHVLLSAQESKIEMTATDLEVGVRIQTECAVSKTGKLCVPAKNLYEIIRETPVSSQHHNARAALSAKRSHGRRRKLHRHRRRQRNRRSRLGHDEMGRGHRVPVQPPAELR